MEPMMKLPTRRYHEMEERIAELEAELAEFKAERKAKHYVHAEFSCAEADRRRKKAEAEVSRLRSEGFRHGSSNCGVPFQEAPR